MARYSGDYTDDTGYTSELVSLEVYLVVNNERIPTSRTFDLQFIPSGYVAATGRGYCKLQIRPRQFVCDIGVNRFIHIPCFAQPGSTEWLSLIDELTGNELITEVFYRGEFVNGGNANLFYR